MIPRRCPTLRFWHSKEFIMAESARREANRTLKAAFASPSSFVAVLPLDGSCVIRRWIRS